MRVLTVVATLCMSVVAIAYGLTWLLPPKAADGRIHVEEMPEGRSDATVTGGMFIVFIGLSPAPSSVGIVNGVGLGWFQLLVLAAAMAAVVAAIVSTVRSASQGGPHRHGAVPPYEMSQHGVSQCDNSWYGTRQQQASATGVSVPFGHSTPGTKDTGSITSQQQNAQAPEGFPTYNVLTGSVASAGTSCSDGTTSAAQGMNAGSCPATARLVQPHVGWITPPSASEPRQWIPCLVPTHHPRTVSGRANLAIMDLLILAAAAVLAGVHMVDKGPTISLIAAQAAEQTITRTTSIGGGVCLIIVSLSLTIVALYDRSAGRFTALFITGLIFAVPMAAIGIEGAQRVNQYINTTMGNTGKQTMLDWRADKVSGDNPTGSTTLDLTGVSVGTSKMIMVDWQAWSQLTIQMAEGQPVQIVCQSSTDTLFTNTKGSGWAAPLSNCSDMMITSLIWGKSSLGGVMALITDEADIDTLAIVQSPDSLDIWGSALAPTPLVTPSVTPTLSTTPIGLQSGNRGRTTTMITSDDNQTTQLPEWDETTPLPTASTTTSGQDATAGVPASLLDFIPDSLAIFREASTAQMLADPLRIGAGTESQADISGTQGSQAQAGVPAGFIGTGGHTVSDPTLMGESTLRGDEAGAAPGTRAETGATSVPDIQTWSVQHTLGTTYLLPEAPSRGVCVGSFAWALLACVVGAFLIAEAYITNPDLPVLGINAAALFGITLVFTILFLSCIKKSLKQGAGPQAAPNPVDATRRG